MLGLCFWVGFSLATVSRDYSLIVRLIAVAPPVAEHGFSGMQLLGSRADSVVMAHRLSCFTACRIFPDTGVNPVSPALAGGFFTN